jgi:AAA domain-containing protein
MSLDDDKHLWSDESAVFDDGLTGVSHRARADSNGHDASRANVWAFPDPEDIRDKLSLLGWLERDVKPPDRLMGEWLTTTSRVEVVAPTGLGKTNLALAIAAFAASGRDFLHWRGSGRPRRVLYVDGEMSERLMHGRLQDAVRRLLGEIPDTLFILSREDFPDNMRPLNTEEGQKFIEAAIDAVGGVDLVVFDNIQALCVGIMKEEESWGPVVPWIRDLTRWRIGQIWIHHTGHNETHGYGTSTREWQLDTVVLLERIERPDADIAFILKFKKARERAPDNRADFEDATITLANDGWSSESGGANVRTGSRTASDRALELLQEAINDQGVIPDWNKHIPPDTPCVTERVWRDYCKRGFLSDGGSPEPVKKAEAERKAFQRASTNLIGSKVGTWDSWVWIVSKK